MKHCRHSLRIAAFAAFAASASPLWAGSRIAPHTSQSTKLLTVHTTVRPPIAQMSPIIPHNPPVITMPATDPGRLPVPALTATRAPVAAISPIAPHNPPVVQLPVAQPLAHSAK